MASGMVSDDLLPLGLPCLMPELRQLQSIVDQMPEGILIARAPDRQITLVNKVAEELLGEIPANARVSEYARHLALKSPEGTPVPARDWPMACALRGEVGREREYLCLRPDGALCHWLFNFGPLRGADGEILGGLVIFRDITERRRAEQALRASEQRFSKAFNVSPHPMAIHHYKDGRYFDVNDSFLRAMGYRREELIGRTPVDINAWGRDEDHRRFLQCLRERQPIVNMDGRVRTKSGELRDVLVSAEVVELGGERFVLSVMNDITERKRAEEALRALEERFSKAFNASPLPMSIRRLKDGVFVDLNDAYLRASGFTRDEIVGRTPIEVGLWQDPADHEQVLQRLRAGKPVRNMEGRFRLKSGRHVVALLSSEVIEIEGEPCLLTITNDITERKQAEEALRASEERFFKAFYASPQPMSISTVAEGRLIEVNDAFLSANGYTREEMIGRTSLELGLWADPQDRARMARILAEKGTVRNEEYPFRIKNGDIRVFLLSAEIITIGDQKCFLVVTNDITERKQTEMALRASEERFSKAFHSNPMPMSIATLRRGRYVDVNESFLRVGGYTREEVIGRTTDELGVWATKEDRYKFAHALRQQGAVRDLEIHLRKRTGELLTALLSGEIIEIGGEPCVLVTTNDITERKRAEEALRASDARYRAFVEQSSDGIYRIELEQPLPFVAPEDEQVEHIYRYSYIAECNDTTARMYGYPSAGDMIGRRLEDFLVRSDANNLAYLLTFIRSGYRLLEDESYELDAEGNPKWFLNTVVGIVENGFLVRIWGAQRDVTERKHVERQRAELLKREQAARHEAEQMNALRAELLEREKAAHAEAEAARREWQTTFDTMTDVVMLIDRDDRLIRANHAFYKRVGRAPDQCVGRPVSELLHNENSVQPAAAACPVCRMRRKGERGVMELPAGVITSYPVLESIDPIVGSDGKTVAVVQVVRDLTALYKAREEAERERMSLVAIIEQMAEGMLVCDENGAIIHANQPALRIFGFTLEQARADHDGSLPKERFADLDGRTVKVSDLPTRTALRERRIVDARLWFTGGDGRRKFLSVTASPFFNNQNDLAGAIALVRDVTEQQRESERLQQAEKLRALGQLASGVAHNFNNALAAVIGYTQLALPKVKNTDVEKHLRVIEQSAKDAARMVERIQNFSRGARQADGFRVVRLADIVRDAIDLTRPRWRHDAEAQGLTYEVRLDWQASEDLLIKGDATELREVFVNIIFNALDAMPGGGSLDIRASAQEATVGVSLADAGIGMTEEVKRRVFEPFFTTKGVAGFGMGLSESYRIVERHGGRIDVESRVRQGATFTVTLPVVKAPENLAPLPPVPPPVKSARVLAIDDEQSVRSVLAEILIEQGHEVIEADNAEDALVLLQSIPFDIVFTDLAMPGTDGIAAASRIKACAPPTKVVLMSGYGADKAAEMARDADCIDAAISKPFHLEEIQDTLKRLLAPKRS